MVKKIILSLIVIIAILSAVSGFVFTWEGSTDDIRAAANRINPPKNWSLVSEQIEPPRIICLGAMSCPSLNKTWRTDDPPSSNSLDSILQDAKFYSNQTSSCGLDPKSSGTNIEICKSKIKTGKFSGNIFINYSTLSKEYTLHVNLEESRGAH